MSAKDVMEDNVLLQELIAATGLPTDLVANRLKALLLDAGVSPKDATMEHVREVLADLLSDVFLELQTQPEKADLL